MQFDIGEVGTEKYRKKGINKEREIGAEINTGLKTPH